MTDTTCTGVVCIFADFASTKFITRKVDSLISGLVLCDQVHVCVCLFNSSQTVTLVLGVNDTGLREAHAEHVKVSCCMCYMSLRSCSALK